MTTGIPGTKQSSSRTIVLAVRHEAACGDIMFRALEAYGPATPHEIASSTGVPESLVRSALQALASVHCLAYDRTNGRYSLWCEWPRST